MLPILATAGVVFLSRSPRSPLAYCRIADQYFGDLQLSGDAHRAGGEDATNARRLADESGQGEARAPSALKSSWRQVATAARRMHTSGTAPGAGQTQTQIDTALAHLHDDYAQHCQSVLVGVSTKPLDLAGLVGQPPSVVYCHRAMTLFSDLLARGTEPLSPDRLLAEALSVVSVVPSALAPDWASTVDALRRLQQTGSSVDATHTQDSVDAAVKRLAGDYTGRCPAPFPSSP